MQRDTHIFLDKPSFEELSIIPNRRLIPRKMSQSRPVNGYLKALFPTQQLDFPRNCPIPTLPFDRDGSAVAIHRTPDNLLRFEEFLVHDRAEGHKRHLARTRRV